MSGAVDNQRWRRLGFTLDDYERMLAQQGGVCAIRGCGSAPGSRRLHVDHDHRTNKVRGLLCYTHNRRLWAGATADEARAIAEYLDAA